MRFLADMGVALRVMEWLRAQGHDAVHLRDEGLQRMPNGEIVAKAASEERVILACGLDFGEIVALRWPPGRCDPVPPAQHADAARD